MDTPQIDTAIEPALTPEEIRKRDDEQRKHDAEIARRERQINEAFERTPPRYYSVDWALHPNYDACMALKEYKFENDAGSGLILHGADGMGKNRAAFKYLHFYAATFEGFSFEVVRAVELVQFFVDRKKEKEIGMTEFSKLKETPLLFISNLHQVELTQKYAERLFHLLAYRVDNQIPTLITLNSENGDWLRALTGRKSKYKSSIMALASELVKLLTDHFFQVDFGNGIDPDDQGSETEPEPSETTENDSGSDSGASGAIPSDESDESSKPQD